MQNYRRHVMLSGTALVMLNMALPLAVAQAYPTRPIRVIVPYKGE